MQRKNTQIYTYITRLDSATDQSIPVCQDQPLKQQETVGGWGKGSRTNTPLPVGTRNKPLQHRLSVPQFSPPNEYKFRLQNYPTQKTEGGKKIRITLRSIQYKQLLKHSSACRVLRPRKITGCRL